jgi:thiol-disulfide isomerase/thioredoxin
MAVLATIASAGLVHDIRAADVAVRPADVTAILGEVRKPGAKAVLVNVWATWCEPCRDEMPLLLKFFRAHRDEGLRLLLVSADDDADRDKVVGFLTSQGVDFPTWMKRGDDMTFIDALDPRWSGALPASFLFDGRGRLQQRWSSEVTEHALETAWGRLASRRKGK